MIDIDDSLGVAELAKIISKAPEQERLNAVLSGGSVVSIYGYKECQSYDLDIVTQEALNEIKSVMENQGFEPSTVATLSIQRKAPSMMR